MEVVPEVPDPAGPPLVPVPEAGVEEEPAGAELVLSEELDGFCLRLSGAVITALCPPGAEELPPDTPGP